MNLSRRILLVGAAASGCGLARPALAEPVLTDDGLYAEPWLLESFLDLREDLAEAAEKAKRYAVIWELKGCPACRQMHLVTFARPEIAALLRERFAILQLNIIGSRTVTDFDGETLSEKRLAEKYEVRATPCLQFFPARGADLSGKPARERELARAQGFIEPSAFLNLLSSVAERV